MDLSLVPLLRCPACEGELEARCDEPAGEGYCRSGALECTRCGADYPIDDWALELLAGGAAALGEDQAHQREHFDDLATRGDRYSYRALGEMPFQIALRRLAFSEWERLIPEGSLVLDIGCADGISTFDVARPGVRALGIDISAESISQAVARAQHDRADNVSFVVADADSLPIEDGALDCVLCFGSLHHMPDPGRTMAEAARVLRPGGTFVGMENHATPLRPVFDLLMRLRPIWREEAGAQALLSEKQLRAWTQGTGLTIESRPTVLVPPHLANRLSVAAAERLLRRSEAFMDRIPAIRPFGGLIAITGRKLGDPSGTRD